MLTFTIGVYLSVFARGAASPQFWHYVLLVYLAIVNFFVHWFRSSFWSTFGESQVVKSISVRWLQLLRLESPSGKCVKLHTVAASNNRVNPTRISSSPSGSTINCSPGSQALLAVNHQDYSIIACSRHIYGCCSSRTYHSWWIAHLTQRQRRGCNTITSIQLANVSNS